MLRKLWMLLTVSCDLKILTLWCFWWEQCGQCCGRYCMLTRLGWRRRWCGSCWRDGWRQSKTLHVDRLVGGGRLRRRKEEMWSQCNMQSHNKQYAICPPHFQKQVGWWNWEYATVQSSGNHTIFNDWQLLCWHIMLAVDLMVMVMVMVYHHFKSSFL